MNLLQSIKVSFPNSAPNPELISISRGLSNLLNTHIVPGLSPVGLANSFLSEIPNKTPTVLAIAAQLELGLGAIIQAGIAAMANPATSTPTTAWLSVKSLVNAIPMPPYR